jgi:uncharacterized protein
MKIKYFLPILSLIGVIFGSCQSNKTINNAEISAQKVADPQLEKSLLWEISGNGLKETSFLYGTIHIIDKEDYFLPAGTLSAIDKSEKVFFEIDMTQMSDVSKLMPLMQKAFMDNDLTLKDLLNDEDYKLVNNHFKELGLPLFFLEKIKPMFLTVFASGDMSPGDLQNGDIKSYEMEFMKIAENSGKTIGGLETIDYQISIFDSIPYKDQANMLVESIKSTDVGDDQMKELVDLYIAQDIAGLYKIMQGDENISEYEDVLLFKRNANWIPIMNQNMASNRSFFAVGAGHLGGAKGVINLLRQEGYSVKPFKG